MKNRFSKLTIEEYTSIDPITVSPSTNLENIINLFHTHKFRHIPVVEGGRPVGIISDRDILLSGPMGVTAVLCAKDIMTTEPYCVAVNAPLEEVTLELSQRKFGSAIVVNEKGGVHGIFTATDALNALIELLRAPL